MHLCHRLSFALLLAALPAALHGQTTDPRALERDIMKELVEINTGDSAGHTPEAAKAVARRLAAAGIPDSDISAEGMPMPQNDWSAAREGRVGLTYLSLRLPSASCALSTSDRKNGHSR